MKNPKQKKHISSPTPSDQNKVTWVLLLRATSCWIFNISSGGDFTISLCNLFLSLTNLSVETLFLHLNLVSYVLVCALSLFSSHWAPLRRVYSFCFGPSHIFMCCSDVPDPACLQAEKLQLSQHFLVCQVIQSLYHLSDSLLNLLQYSSICLALERPKQDPALQICLTRVEQEGRITSLNFWLCPSQRSHK